MKTLAFEMETDAVTRVQTCEYTVASGSGIKAYEIQMLSSLSKLGGLTMETEEESKASNVKQDKLRNNDGNASYGK